MASYRRKAFGKSTQEYIDKAKMGGYVGMIYMYDELTHEYLTGWSGLSVDVNCQTLIISLLQKLVSAKQFRADQDLDDPNEVSFSINPDTKEHEAAAKHNTNKPDATLTVPDSISNKSKTSNQSTPNPRKRLRSADKDEDITQVTYYNADDGTETDRDIKPDIMAIPVQAGYSATPTMSLSGLEPIAAASNTPDNQKQFDVLSRKVDDLRVLFHRLADSSGGAQLSVSDPVLPRFETAEDLLNYSITDVVEREEMIRKINLIGGKDMGQAVRTLLKRLMTPEVQLQFNMKGLGPGDKKSFSETDIYVLLLDALIRKWNVTENEIVRKMADYLRGARSRWENECGRQLTTIELTSTSDTSNTPDVNTEDEESESLIKRIPKSSVPQRRPTSQAFNSPVRKRVRSITSSSTEPSPPGSPILPSPPPTNNHQPPPASRNNLTVKEEPRSDNVTLEVLHTNSVSLEKQLLNLTSIVQQIAAHTSLSACNGTGTLPYFHSAEEVVLYDVADEEERKGLVLKLASIGGLNLQRGVATMLNKLMSLEAMTGLNMLGGGTRGKRGIKNTALYQVILESLIQYFKVSEAEVYAKVQGFLKDAEGKRKKAAARASSEHWFQSDDQTYDGESESVIKGIPKSPVPLRKPTSPASNSPVRRRVRLLTSSSTEQSPPGSPILPSPPPTDNHQPPPASRNSSAASVQQHSRYDQMRSGTVSVKTEPSSDCVTLEILHTNTASIEKQLLKLTSMVQHLSACSSHSVGYGTYGTGVLPYFNSAEEVVLYDVADEEERKSLVLRLASIGGLNLQKGVVNMLTQLMSVEAMTSLNMLGGGTRGKRGFKNTALYQVVLESLIQYFKVSEAEVYTKVQGFLKNAEGTRKKAAARANNEHWIQPGDNP